jgi:hypothetical protein
MRGGFPYVDDRKKVISTRSPFQSKFKKNTSYLDKKILRPHIPFELFSTLKVFYFESAKKRNPISLTVKHRHLMISLCSLTKLRSSEFYSDLAVTECGKPPLTGVPLTTLQKPRTKPIIPRFWYM